MQYVTIKVRVRGIWNFSDYLLHVGLLVSQLFVYKKKTFFSDVEAKKMKTKFPGFQFWATATVASFVNRTSLRSTINESRCFGRKNRKWSRQAGCRARRPKCTHFKGERKVEPVPLNHSQCCNENENKEEEERRGKKWVNRSNAKKRKRRRRRRPNFGVRKTYNHHHHRHQHQSASLSQQQQQQKPAERGAPTVEPACSRAEADAARGLFDRYNVTLRGRRRTSSSSN